MINGVAARGFSYKPSSCWCESNPSHPAPECNQGSASFPDDHIRYDIMYADSNCIASQDSAQDSYYIIDHFVAKTNENFYAFDLQQPPSTLVHTHKTLKNSDYVEITFEKEATAEKCSRFCTREKVLKSNYFQPSDMNPCESYGAFTIDTIEECELAFESTGKSVDPLYNELAPQGCSLTQR